MVKGKVLAGWVTNLATLQLLVMAALVVTGFMSSGLRSSKTAIIAGLGMLCAGSGVFGAVKMDRNVLLFYFITQTWACASMTMEVYDALTELRARELFCEELGLAKKLFDSKYKQSPDLCPSMENISWGKTGATSLAALFTMFGSYATLLLSEKIQQERDVAQMLRMQSAGTQMKKLSVANSDDAGDSGGIAK